MPEEKSATLTLGVDHIGITVSDLEKTLSFFVDCLDWKKFGGDPSYPSAYVTDGGAKVTLWQAKVVSPLLFDRHANIGLHHLAFKVSSDEDLHKLYTKVSTWAGVNVEFSPEFSGKGPKVHFMINEPSGNRLEFSYDPR